MLFSGVDVPEPFAAALAEGRARDVTDAAADTPAARFGRALCRIAVGSDALARDELVALTPELGDSCLIELAFLDLRQRSALRHAAEQAREIAERVREPSLAGRAWHILGLAHGKLRRNTPAIDALLQAQQYYTRAGLRAARAQVRDTLGMVQAARGKLDDAVQCYALSLVDKALLGERAGMALTLGNLGRLHLRAGRYGDAIECLERDLEIAREIDDRRGVARVLNDLGRVALADGRLDEAERYLHENLQLVEAWKLNDGLFFAHKDLAQLRLAQGRKAEADAELTAARAALPTGGEPYLELLYREALGELLAARGDAQAIDVLRAVVEGFREAELPDLEIAARIALAGALVEQRLKVAAESCLIEGLKLARTDGYGRYVAALNEAMARLALVEGALDEHDREIASDVSRAREGDYLVRQQLGTGGFGEVFRVYDARRGMDVALKRLHLDQLYDTRKREQLIRSARTELEAASRVRHPGVVRIYAIGTEPDGGLYLVQELLTGGSLRRLMPGDATAPLTTVLPKLIAIAHSLEALHAAGVVHRDLKPENVLLREDGSPVLVDFGISWLKSAAGDKERAVAGTLEYMAPEQASGKAVDARADLYALGVIAFEWLAGTLPLRFSDDSDAEQLEALKSRLPPPLTDFRPSAPPALQALIASLLRKRQGQRPATARDVAEALISILDALPR